MPEAENTSPCRHTRHGVLHDIYIEYRYKSIKDVGTVPFVFITSKESLSELSFLTPCTISKAM